MEVILLEKVAKLGSLGDKVKVKSGFGRNFLIPYGKAVPATAENLVNFEERRAELQAAADKAYAEAKARADAMGEFSITIPANAGDEGKLFGSIGTRDIAEAVSKAGHEIQKSEVLMPLGVIREIGDYTLGLKLHSDIDVEINVKVVSEND